MTAGASSTARRPLTGRSLNQRLFRWHASHARQLAIRETRDPWAILVAEVMSQQTGVERIQQTWASFLHQWPTPDSLAAAGTPDLLAAWVGLGYNRRALALRESARTIVSQHGGRVPRALGDLMELPGVGPYTARAVAASAFGMRTAPLDVNVRRVIGRVTGTTNDLQSRADQLVSRREPRRWLDAVMDLSALICHPTPNCAACPLADDCLSFGVASDPGPRRLSVRFETTRRWLRGQLVALAAANHGDWITIPVTIGAHGEGIVRLAALDLQAEGFLELDGNRMRVAA